MIRKLLLVAGLCASTAASAIDYKIVTASERGTYIQIGRDLATHVAPAADIQLEALPSPGATANVKRLRHEPGVKLALVQSDVYQAYVDLAIAGDRSAAQLISPIRVVLPLYNEEAYFIVRADSPLNYVHEIKDQRISVPLGSGAALTATTMYNQMFGSRLPDDKTSFRSDNEGLGRLIGEKDIDVVVVVAGQPAKVLSDMQAGAKDLIKLLKFDPNHARSKEALKTYVSTTIRQSNYPNLLTEDIPALAVKAYLTTYNYEQTSAATKYLGAFGKSLCENFNVLQSKGHPKWKEVKLELPPLGRGWAYYKPTTDELRKCGAPVKAASVAPVCTQQYKILGLCQQ